MVGAAVPVAPVQKDGNPLGLEDEIGGAPPIGDRAIVDAKPQSATMHDRPKGNLRLGVPASVASH